MKIYSPVKNANGIYASVMFVNGVGETDNPALIEWFRKHGYRVPIEELVTKSSASFDIGNIIDDSEFVEINNLADDEPDLESMTPNELRDYAKANGYGGLIKNTRNKDKLLQILRG